MPICEETASQVLVAVMVFTGVWYVWKRQNYASHVWPGTRVPNCLKSVPFLGSLPFMLADINCLPNYLMEQSANYGSVFALYLGSSYTVVLNGAEVIKEALLKKSDNFADRPPIFLARYFNHDLKGVVFSRYNDQFRQKRQLYLSIMKKFGFGQRLMETRINGEVSELIKQARLTDGKPFDPNDMLHMCIVNVISSILLGQRYEFNDPVLKELVHLIHETVSAPVGEVQLFPVLRFIPPFRRRIRIYINDYFKLMKIVAQQIDDTIAQCSNKQDDVNDDVNDSFVRQFIKSTPTGEDYDREELLQTARDLFQAGDDTSATTLRWVLFHLANHPDVQSRLQDEVDDVIGVVDRLPSLSDEANMPYTQAFILETMRRRTLVPLLLHATLCDTQVEDCFVPAGTTVFVNQYSVHMNPSSWSEPHAFRPERFLNEHGQVTGKERIFPFSLGKRSCLGESLARQELFLFTSGVVQNFDVRPPEGQTEVTCTEKTTALTEPSSFQIRMIRRMEKNRLNRREYI